MKTLPAPVGPTAPKFFEKRREVFSINMLYIYTIFILLRYSNILFETRYIYILLRVQKLRETNLKYGKPN